MSDQPTGPTSVDTTAERVPSPARRWWAHLPQPTTADLETLGEPLRRVETLWPDWPARRDDAALAAALREGSWHPGDRLEHVEEVRELLDAV